MKTLRLVIVCLTVITCFSVKPFLAYEQNREDNEQRSDLIQFLKKHLPRQPEPPESL